MKKQSIYTILPILNQLQIKYDIKNIEDITQLKMILTQKLSYPSTDLALIHQQANRLGTYDLYQPKQSLSVGQSQQQSQEQKIDNKQTIYCQCCGLIRQIKYLNMCTKFRNIKHLGISARLLVMAFQHTLLIMFIMFLLYSLFAIISNVKSCNYDSSNLLPQYQTQQYYSVVKNWIFQTSLHANIVCNSDTRTYQIQCWLGVAFIVLSSIILTSLKYKKYRACLILQRLQKSVDKLSIYIQNLPLNINMKQLQHNLQQYRKIHVNTQIPQSFVQIKIVKISRAAPFYLSSSLFKDQQIKNINSKYKQLRQTIIQFILHRIKQPNFRMDRQNRTKIYQQFEQVKKQRIQIYKNTVLNKVLIQNERNQKKVITAPSFITFQSSFNRDFILKMTNNSLKHLTTKSQPFYFIDPNNDIKLKADIEQAPKPQQVIWQNLGQNKNRIIIQRIIFFILTLAFLAGTCVAFYYMSKLNFDLSNNHTNIQVTTSIYYLTAFVQLVLSYIISDMVLYLNKKQRNITYMHQQRSLNNKATIATLSNWMLVPLIFNFFFKNKFVSIIALAQTVFTISLFASYYFVVLKIADPMYFWSWIQWRRTIRPKNKLRLTQLELNKKAQQMQFMPGFQCSYMIRSFLVTCLYSPLQPIIIIFLFTGLFCMYLQQKYCLFNRCTRPISGNSAVNISVYRYLAAGPILFGIGCLVWPYYINKKVIAITPSVISISVGVFMAFFPTQKIIDKIVENSSVIKQCRKRIQVKDKNKLQSQIKQVTKKTVRKQKLYSRYKYRFAYQYDRTNYLTSQQAILKHMKQINQLKNVKTQNISQIKLYSPGFINNIQYLIKNNRRRKLASFFNHSILMNKYKDPKQLAMDLIKKAFAANFKFEEDNSQKSYKQFQTQEVRYGKLQRVFSHAYNPHDNQILVNQIINYIKKNRVKINDFKTNSILYKQDDSQKLQKIKNSNIMKQQQKQNIDMSNENINKNSYETQKEIINGSEILNNHYENNLNYNNNINMERKQVSNCQCDLKTQACIIM